jgi:hypothetical protein
MTELKDAPTEHMFYGSPLKFNPKQHRYEWEGKSVPGVTSILRRLNKPALINWAANCAVDHIEASSWPHDELPDHLILNKAMLKAARGAHNAIRDTAADVGKTVHSYAEAILLGKPSSVPVASEAERKGIAAFEAWLAEHTVEPEALECRVLSRRHYYAGTTDFYGRIDGKVSVLDFKTSSAIYPEYWLQTTAYELALNEQREYLGEDPVDMVRWIIRLDKKTGKFEAQSRPWTALHEDAWVSLVSMNKYLTRIEKLEDGRGI